MEKVYNTELMRECSVRDLIIALQDADPDALVLLAQSRWVGKPYSPFVGLLELNAVGTDNPRIYNVLEDDEKMDSMVQAVVLVPAIEHDEKARK